MEKQKRQGPTCYRDSRTKERKVEKAAVAGSCQERDHPRHAAQTVSERQATSQWKCTSESGAETPEEKQTRNGSSVIRHFEGGNYEDVME